VPVPLIDNAPGPVHGRPVSGFVPVVLDRSPVGVAGEMLSSDRAGKSVLCPLSTGLTVFPLSKGLLVFCASDTAVVAVRTRTLSAISSKRFVIILISRPSLNIFGSSGNNTDDRSPLSAPWSIEDIGAAFVVKDGSGQKPT
jgi:hypothetical protein